MSLKVISSRPRSYPDRYIADGFNLYPDSNATELVDKFFSENKIYSLPFKCKTWGKLTARATKMDIGEIRKAWPMALKVSYSHTTGCRCGCSPGYKIRGGDTRGMGNRDICCEIKVDISDLKKDMPKFQKMLDEEIKANKVLSKKA